jgi:hypothetical protein
MRRVTCNASTGTFQISRRPLGLRRTPTSGADSAQSLSTFEPVSPLATPVLIPDDFEEITALFAERTKPPVVEHEQVEGRF